MREEEELDDPPEYFEAEARDAVKSQLRHASWDTERKEVHFAHEEMGGHYPICGSMEELRQYLVDKYTEIWYAAAPSEGGGAVFDSMDEMDIVNEELEEYREQIESLGWEL